MSDTLDDSLHDTLDGNLEGTLSGPLDSSEPRPFRQTPELDTHAALELYP